MPCFAVWLQSMNVSLLCCSQSGGIKPLVTLLRDDPDEISAELAAVVLRNLALQNAVNRAAIKDAGGLQPLLRLLSMGQEKLVYPLTCEVCTTQLTSNTSLSNFILRDSEGVLSM